MNNEVISFSFAIFSIINIMIGSGIFFNTVPLLNQLGIYSALIYLMIGFFTIPIVIIFYIILREFPKKNFYDIGEECLLGGGKILSISYVIGKMGTVAIGLLIASKIILMIFGSMVDFSFLAIFFVIFYIMLLLINLKIKKTIQGLFFIGKLIPISLVIWLGIKKFFLENFSLINISCSSVDEFSFNNFFSCLPLGIFSFAGLESFFSISSSIKNKKKNGSLSIVFGFLLVLIIYLFYQYSISLISSNSFLYSTFEELFFNIFINDSIRKVILIGIVFSSLGTSYGTMYNNLFSLLNIKPFSLKPTHCSLILGFISFSYILFFNANWIIIQQMSISGTLTAYIFFIFYFFLKFARKNNWFLFLAFLGGLSTGLMFLGVLHNGISNGFTGYMIFIILIIALYFIFYRKKNNFLYIF